MCYSGNSYLLSIVLWQVQEQVLLTTVLIMESLTCGRYLIINLSLEK
jgi:hypothetical protein